MITFEPKQEPAYIKVIGVGGGGSNAVNHMFKQGIKGVEFAICNTDVQSLDISPVPNKIRIGDTDGLGAGSKPDVGEDAAKTSIEALKEAFNEDIKMLFITAGMGGGTGTGAAPIIAHLAQEMGILTVGIVTLPFSWEGRRRKQQAQSGIDSMKEFVDTLLVINNDKLREQYGNLPVRDAFARADNVLSTAAKGIAEIITVPGYVNTDFEDVKTVIKNSGKAIMGSATAEGENRAMTAIEEAMNSPLLDDNDIKGAQNILLHIVTGTDEITMDEITEITEYVQAESGNEADLIWGQGYDETLENKIGITLIATGFDSKNRTEPEPPKKKVHTLTENDETEKPEAAVEETDTVTDTEARTEESISEIKLINKSEELGEENPEEEIVLLTDRKDADDIELDAIEEMDDELEEEIPQTEFTFKREFDLTESSYREEESMTNEIERTPSVQKEDGPEYQDEHPNTIQFKQSPTIPDQSHLAIQRTVKDFEIGVITHKPAEGIDEEVIEKNANDRINKLKNLSRVHSAADIEDLESVPAFRRKKIELDNTPPSTYSPVSKFTLGEDSNNNPVIKSDNSFLHDNVD